MLSEVFFVVTDAEEVFVVIGFGASVFTDAVVTAGLVSGSGSGSAFGMSSRGFALGSMVLTGLY